MLDRDRPRRPELIALSGVVLLATGLRVVGAAYGLPYPLLNPDEASIVPRAWRMVHGAGLDPGWFDYPSLLMYLLAPLQALTDGPSYGVARVVAVVVGVCGVAAAWWLGRRSYGGAAGLVGAAGVADADLAGGGTVGGVIALALLLGAGTGVAGINFGSRIPSITAMGTPSLVNRITSAAERLNLLGAVRSWL